MSDRALTVSERLVLMRVILKRGREMGRQPTPMMQEESTQRALRGEVLSPNEVKFYVERVALWDTSGDER